MFPLYSTRLPSVCMIACVTVLPLVPVDQRAPPEVWSYHTRSPSVWSMSLKAWLEEKSEWPGVSTWPGANVVLVGLPFAVMVSTVRKLAWLDRDTLPDPPAV